MCARISTSEQGYDSNITQGYDSVDVHTGKPDFFTCLHAITFVAFTMFTNSYKVFTSGMCKVVSACNHTISPCKPRHPWYGVTVQGHDIAVQGYKSHAL